jgi:DNA-directed RNA polymerase specialized sigma24 family protein
MTLWGAVRGGDPRSAQAARNALVLRYATAVRRYLVALLRDDDRADEVTQAVLLRILQGAFDGWDPARGKFRWYLQRAVRNAALDAARSAHAAALPTDLPADGADPDGRWADAWRQSALEQALEGLRTAGGKRDGVRLARLLIDHPDADAEESAGRLAEATGRPHKADAVRQQVRRLRLRFAELLVEQVRQTLSDPSPAAVEDELTETGLMPYVRRFLPADWRTRGELQPEE